MDNENYISPNKITKQYDITSGTLRRWAEAGKIRCLRPNGGKRIYNIEDIKKIFNKENNKDENATKNENDEEKTINFAAQFKEELVGGNINFVAEIKFTSSIKALNKRKHAREAEPTEYPLAFAFVTLPTASSKSVIFLTDSS